jgi:DNA-binding transcriptional ArsR family regulator
MTAPFEPLSSLDRLVHEPARLAILTALSSCRRADFLFLQSLTGLGKGNLSSHLDKLEEAHLVRIEKSFNGKVPQTHISLTAEGRQAIAGHWRRLEGFRKALRGWRKRLAGSEPDA